MSVISCLAYFTQRNVLKVHPCRSMCQNVLPIKGWIIFYCMDNTTFYLSTHPWMGTWLASTFWLQWRMLLQTWVNKYLFKSLLSILLGLYPEVELLGQVVILCLVFWGTSILFSTAVVPFYILANSSRFQFLHIFANACVFLFWVFMFLFLDSSHSNGCEVV